MNIENQPLGGDEDDLSTADFGNDLNPPAAEPPADPPPADPAGDPASADGGPPAGGDHEGEDPEASSVPYGRFKEVNDAKKTLASQLAEREAEIAALKAAQAPPQPAAPAEPPADPIAQLGSQLDELYDQVESLRLEGETKEAAKVQRQIDGINQEILLEKSRRIAAQTNSVTKVAEQYNKYLDALESAFPELVKGTDAFDPAKVEDINVTAGAYEKAGMHPLNAIKKATKLVLGQTLEDRLAAAAKAAAPPDKPAAPAAPATKPRDLNKAVDAANRQPPDMTTAGVNRDDTKIDVSRLSDEEFDKLPLSKQRELRGDFA